MNNAQKEFKDKFPSGLVDEPLSRYCTFLVGGPADMLYRAQNTTDIPELISFAKAQEIPYLIIGGGSNLLFDDKGFRGLVIKIECRRINIDGDEITADSGVTVAELLNFSIRNGLSGLEKWIGLPGTVGGAVRGNAGCNGLETKEVIVKATILSSETGETREVDNEYFEYDYRTSLLKETGEIVLNATFKLANTSISKEEQLKVMQEIKQFRQQAQPYGSSSGSFFKNPSLEQPAGMLIDQAGLKGKTVNKTQISEKHGNFLLNLGGATSEDIKELANLAKQEVKAKFDIELEEEVQILDEYGKTKL
ncbi:UDP-N-acetylmuramate dehydrogenase [Candidatus Peregrinibacteria bacterium]|nr:UDP-N-acetylmuramate dehydrogenase [Candidatus Peregrinibacteria bacterium]MBT7736487.1 UDP-N-acetylmuramate dehydrogenase [Candidatus Peregrinibacteria bacterium]